MSTTRVPRIAGLDLSLSGSAGVILDDTGRPAAVLAYTSSARDLERAEGSALFTLHRSTVVHRGDTEGDFRRTLGVADSLRNWLCRHTSTGSLVGLEDHAFRAQGAAVYQLGHLHGIVRADVVRALASSFVLLSVSEVKRAATGSGTATKDAMVTALGADVDVSSFTAPVRQGIADAYSVARVTWFLDRVRRGTIGTSSLPGDLARMLAPSKGRPGLLERTVVG